MIIWTKLVHFRAGVNFRVQGRQKLVFSETLLDQTTARRRTKGRDHNPDGFTYWMTGAGGKPGVSHGVTDDLGVKGVENKLSLYDFNATVLHLLGLDNTRLSSRHDGFDRRLTDVHGHVIKEILA